jgi:predicted DsbA family dithiol-disulfide isomerase
MLRTTFAMTASITIDLFSDIVCPWCFIGSTRLEQTLATLQGEVEAEVCYHPFLLDPNLPKAGISVPEMLRTKYGADPKQLWARPEAAAKESGVALDLSLQPIMYPTDAAHTLLRHAHAKGTQRALATAFFRSYFLEAKNISDESLLARIAADHGFSHAEALELATSKIELELTREEALSAAQGGIRGVPFFIFDGRLAVSGAQTVAVLTAAIRQAVTQAAPSEAPPSGSTQDSMES